LFEHVYENVRILCSVWLHYTWPRLWSFAA